MMCKVWQAIDAEDELVNMQRQLVSNFNEILKNTV